MPPSTSTPIRGGHGGGNDGPLIPVEFCDVPIQRLYIASIFAAIQSYKLWTALESSFASAIAGGSDAPANWEVVKWTLVDAGFIALLPRLRVPWLQFDLMRQVVLLAALTGINWLLMGSWSFSLLAILKFVPYPGWMATWFSGRLLAVNEIKVSLQQVLDPSEHILGKHTIHILPHSTAKLNPSSQCYCMGPQSPTLQLPILFNNSAPRTLRYSVTDFTTGQQELVSVSAKQLQLASGHRRNANQKWDDWDVEAESAQDPRARGDWALTTPSGVSSHQAHQIQDRRQHQPQAALHHPLPEDNMGPYGKLEKSQVVYTFPVSKVGLVRLERVLDENDMDIRLARSEALVLSCPWATFSPHSPGSAQPLAKRKASALSVPSERCVGDVEELELAVSGTPPLSLTYHSQDQDGRVVPFGLSSLVPPHFSSPLFSLPAPSALSERLESLRGGDPSTYHWAAEATIMVPLNVTLATAGSHTFRLDGVKDACGHAIDISAFRGTDRVLVPPKGKSKPVDVRRVKVYPRSEASFVGCTGEGVKVLKGQTTKLKIEVKDSPREIGRNAESDGPWEIGVRYTPDPAGVEAGAAAGWEKAFKLASRVDHVSVAAPGVYELTSISGLHCSGDVLLPSSCKAYQPPLPAVDLQFAPLTDQCSGETGIKATFAASSGTAPFTVQYSINQSGRPPRHRTFELKGTRGELVIEPESPGTFEYRFERVSDVNYGDVALGRSIKQTVHPLASAEWAQAPGRSVKVWSCRTETAKAELNIKGHGPFDIEYQVAGQPAAIVPGLTSHQPVLSVPIPPQHLSGGGRFAVSLVSITDGNGCKRSLTADLAVEVKAGKPIAKFAGKDGERKKLVRQYEVAKLPVRLSGEGPWSIKYRHVESSSLNEATLHQANSDLLVDRAGLYELLEVHDAHCVGNVEHPEYLVEHLPRPTLGLASGAGDLEGGVHLRAPVCQRAQDSVGLQFQGSPPYSAAYQLTRHVKRFGSKPQPRTIQAIQAETSFQLYTSEAGVHEYDVFGVSDRVYDTLSRQGLQDTHRSGVIKLRQEVWPFPSGILKLAPKTAYCVSETLSSKNGGSQGVKVELTGQAPFDVEIELKDGGAQSSEVYKQHIETATSYLDLPFLFRSPSPHVISIRSIRDAHGCEADPEHLAAAAVTFQVAEIASISPVSQKPHYCVGETLDFVLQGSSPWVVEYDFNGRRSEARVKEPRFSRLAKEPGTFRITGVSQQSDQCTARPRLESVIRPIPVARISAGNTYVENIREGDQSEIVFTFEGTPPFSFTYTKSLPEDTSKDRRVLEQHTVTGVTDYQYSIFAREQGTWRVTYIQDAYCSFPPAKMEAKSK